MLGGRVGRRLAFQGRKAVNGLMFRGVAERTIDVIWPDIPNRRLLVCSKTTAQVRWHVEGVRPFRISIALLRCGVSSYSS